MGALCCNLIHKDKSSLTHVNEELLKSNSIRTLVTNDDIAHKCIKHTPVMSQSQISSHSNSQHINNHMFNKDKTLTGNTRSMSLYDNQLYQFMDFPFLTSLCVIRWLMSTKIIFILRGPSGSGKSTIVDCLTDKFPNATVCCSDNFFVQPDGSLNCDRSRLKEAGKFAQNHAYQILESGKSPAIIDNTHIRCLEYKYYVDLSLKFDYLIIIIVPKTPWRFDVEQLHQKSPKSEPIWEIEKSINQFEPAIPLYYGWFLNDHDSDHILQIAADILDLFISMPEIRLGLAAACDVSEFVSKEDLIDHWTIKTDRLHVTTKFCGYGTTSDSEDYLNSGSVQESLGQLFPVHIKGLLLTPRTFSCHIQLAGPKQIQLWAGDDQEDVTITKSVSKPIGLSKMTALGKLNVTKSPRRPFGCRAHMALMLSDGVRPVQSGIDQLQIIDLQLKNEKGHVIAVIESGTIIEWGHGRYYLELNCPLIYQALFTGQY